MATNRTFSAMLNQYVPNALLFEEQQDRNWFMKNVEHDQTWLSGDLIVAFQGAQASNVSFGSLTASNDVGESIYVRGSITTQPELWGTLQFQQRDLMEHGKLNEQNLLKLLPGEVDRFMDYVKGVTSLSFLNGTYFATTTAVGTSGGVIVVDRPDRFVIGQKVSVDDSDSSPVSGYVRTIDMDTAEVTLYDARTGGSVVDMSGYAVGSQVFFVGSQANGFSSLKASLLSATNGGSSSLYGQSKLGYTYLQAIQVAGATVTSANILQKLFDGYTRVRMLGKGNAATLLMSFRNLGWVMSNVEALKGAYHIDQTSTKVSNFGWTEIEIVGVKGRLKCVGIQEMDDDWIAYLDMRALKMYSNGGFRKRVAPDGKEYFEVRNTTGYVYLVDIVFAGDMVLERPSTCGVMFGIPLTDNAA